MDTIWQTVWHELTSGLWSGTEVARVAVRLVVAMLLGAVVGYERTAAVGVAVGLGFAGSAVLSVALAWIALTAVGRLEAKLNDRAGRNRP